MLATHNLAPEEKYEGQCRQPSCLRASAHLYTLPYGLLLLLLRQTFFQMLAGFVLDHVELDRREGTESDLKPEAGGLVALKRSPHFRP